ncbi:MAG: hypothetical protein ACL7BU_13545 [Candidatus Phlomobacter fragariae]
MMLTANTPLLAKLAENHTQMVIAHNQLAEAHKMLISQLVGHFESEPGDTIEANKPKPFAPDIKPQLATPVTAEPKKAIKPAPVITEKTVKAEPKPEPVDIESLDLRHIVAMSVLFGDKAVKPDNMQVAKAKETFASKKADSVTGQIDALYCALNGISKVQTLSKARCFDLCLKMLDNWNNIPGITERREFALSLLGEAPSDAEIKPDYKAMRNEAATLINQLVKGGYRNEVIKIFDEFNAKRLSDVTDDNLAQFIGKLESVLADETAEGSDG